MGTRTTRSNGGTRGPRGTRGTPDESARGSRSRPPREGRTTAPSSAAPPSPPRTTRSRSRDAGTAARPPRLRLEVDARRAQLLALGIEQFGRHPYDDVAIDAIAQAAGISKGLLYHYFPTKRAFYVACVREAASDLLAKTHAIEGIDAMAPLERLVAGIDTYLDYVRAHGHAYATLMRSGAGFDREITEIVDRTRATFIERLTSETLEATVGAGGSPSPTAGARANANAPLVRIALLGWVGLAEAASIAWVERCVAAEAAGYDGAPAPTAESVRDLLANALLAIIPLATRL